MNAYEIVNFTTMGMRSEELAEHLWGKGYRQSSRKFKLLTNDNDTIEVSEHIMRRIRTKQNKELFGPTGSTGSLELSSQYQATEVIESLMDDNFEFAGEDNKGTVLCKNGITVTVSVNKEVSCVNCEWKGDVSELDVLEEFSFCPECKRIILKDSGEKEKLNQN